MDLMDTAQLLGNFGEFFGAIAVVVTLGYLASQIRQANRDSRTASTQVVRTGFSDLTSALVADVDSIQVIRKGFGDWAHLTPDEQARVHNYWSTLFGHLTMAHGLFGEGVIDTDTYRAYENNAISALLTPGIATWWGFVSRSYSPAFRDQIEARLNETTSLPPPFTEIMPWYGPGTGI